MERKGYKKGEKEERKRRMQKFWERNFRFWTRNQARRVTLVSFPNFMEEIVVSHLGFDNPKFGRTGETSQSC